MLLFWLGIRGTTMRCAPLCLIAVVVSVSGCISNTEPAKGPSNQAAPDVAERTVRAVISDLLKVNSSAIPMDKPISDPPLKADDLDLVEIVMELEERNEVEISDAAVERYGKLGKGPIRITPNQLVAIVREAPKRQQSKRKK
jgi:acyl carrier protein